MKQTLFCMFAAGAVFALGGVALAAERPATFTKDIAPILQEKCQECHRPGSLAPMSLVTYEETRPWAKSIKLRVMTRQMPPWHIDKTVGVREFKNDMSLSDEQIAAIAAWVDAGAPQGDPKDMPAPKQWPAENEWRAASVLGPPDLVIKSEPYTMAAHHQDVLVEACQRYSADRAALGARGGDAAGLGRGPQDHASCGRVSGAGRPCQRRGRNLRRGFERTRDADGMGRRQGLRPVSSQHRQAAAAGIEDFLGRSHPRRRARKFATTSSWACGFIPKARSPSTALT